MTSPAPEVRDLLARAARPPIRDHRFWIVQGLVLIIGRFLWNMWQRRQQQQPAYAGAPNANASMLHDMGGSGLD